VLTDLRSRWMTTENGWQGTISGSRANRGQGKGKAA